jgi:alkanesulfonate monooxygenase SsuD/methylene tetrahydromethanopterin reductase-like flavin-dependent oxidoreductase (luciferase family)
MEVWVRQSMPYHSQHEGPMPFPVPGWMWDRALGEKLYADRVRFMRRADETGLDGLIFTEHHSGPNGGLTPSPPIMLAAASTVTERIKLVTMGISLALYPHPVRVAEELAMVDNLSHGRLVVGIMSSGAQNLFAYSQSVGEERGRKEEAYELIIKAWTADNPFEWHGEYFNYDCVSVLPRPLQEPYPPIWSPVSSVESFQWCARNHIGVITGDRTVDAGAGLKYYRDYAEAECGWTAGPANVGLAREMYLAPTRAKFEQMAEEVFGGERATTNTYSHMDQDANLKALDRERYALRSYDYREQARVGRSLGGRTLNAITNGTFIAGDPDAVIEQIISQQKATGAGVLVVRPEMGALTLDEVSDELDLFAKEVYPVIKKL